MLSRNKVRLSSFHEVLVLNFIYLGSRTVRTEEAVLITLSTLSDKIEPVAAAPEFKLKDLIAQSEDTGNLQKFGEPMKRKNSNKQKKVKREAPELSGDSDNNVTSPKKANDDDMSRFD